MMMAENQLPPVTSKVIKVLLVEDSLIDACFVQELLPAESYRVEHVESLSEAHARVKTDFFDVAMLDLGLQDSFGIETFLSLQPSLPNTPIIIVTGFDNDAIAIQAIKLGAQDYLPKLGLTEKGLTRILLYSVERFQAQRMLGERDKREVTAKAFLKLALEASNTGVWSYSVGTREVFFDEKMHSIFGLTAGERIGTVFDFLRYVHVDDRRRVADALKDSVNGRNVDYELEYRIVWKDLSEHDLSSRGRLTTESNSQPTLTGICTDVTKYKLEQKNAIRLLVLEKHEDFIATLTHDLKNPLIGADRVLELFLSGAVGVLDEQQLQLLRLLHESNTDMLALIQNLLAVYRFDEGQHSLVFSPVNMETLASDCIRQAALIAQKGRIILKADFLGDQHEILGDSMALSRVFKNLISNALKFTGAGGEVVVSGRKTDKTYVLAVKDTGSGIPDEDMIVLFKRYSQGKLGEKYHGGSGLGLYLCRQLVEAHGGEIVCESKVGIGTSFTVTLPDKQSS
jgi:PAS domain S-box-containing protein